MELKKGDAVKIIAGKDKGKTGQIIKSYPEVNRIVVEGVNIVSKSVRARSANETGGIVEQPAAINASNAQILCPECHEAVRIKHGEVDGKKVRICAKCGAVLDVTSGKAKTTAKKVAKKAKKTDNE